MSKYVSVLEGDFKAPIKACIYGNSAEGKSSIGTALPWGHPRFGDEAIIVCADKSSKNFEGISPVDKPHLRRVTMDPVYNAQTKKWEFDPHEAAIEVATRYWQQDYPNVKTIIWDGGSETAEQMLWAYANMGINTNRATGVDPHLVVGTKGSAGYMAMPMEGDYGVTQNGILRLLEHLENQPMNVIFICQADIYTPKGDAALAENQIGGPATAGGKAINKVLSKFNTVIRAGAKSVSVPGDKPGKTVKQMQYMAYTEKRGIWAAKLRKPPDIENPIAEVDVTGDPGKLWREMMAFYDAL